MADSGVKGNPRFELDEDSDFPDDLTEVSDWAATNVDHSVPLEADRVALTSAWDGKRVFVKETGRLYLKLPTEWIVIAAKPTQGNIGYASGFAADTGVDYLTRTYDDTVTGLFSGTYSAAALGENAFVGTLPTGFRPAGTIIFAGVGYGGGGATGTCVVRIDSNGEIRVFAIAALSVKSLQFQFEFKAA